MQIKRIGLWPNRDKDQDLSVTRQWAEWIAAGGCEPVMPPIKDCDLIIVLGGDGTVLSAAEEAARTDTPLLGVNLGTLGYLTDVEKDEGPKALAAVLEGRCVLEKRMMLEIDGQPWTALNDVCAGRGASSKLARIRLFMNDEYIDTIRADGLIISTPTGSTAYNLSAGGPILNPESEMIAVTAICPHALYLRPWVISAADRVKIQALDAEIVLSMDGRTRSVLKPNEEAVIKRSRFYTTIVKTKTFGFYEILRRKMMHVEEGP